MFSIGNWEGEDVSVFEIPAYTEWHVNNKHKITYPIEKPPVKIPMEDWMRFLGLYIAEGSLGPVKDGKPYGVSISQAPKNRHKVEAIVKAIPFYHSYDGHHFQISGIQIASYIDSLGLGKCDKKYIPKQFKNLSVEYLQALFEGLVAGDGNRHNRTGQISYSTTSKRLADDVQEIIMKLGMVANVIEIPTKGTTMNINGKEYVRNHNQFRIAIRKQNAGIRSSRHYLPKRVPYNGKVYCLEVPNRIMYVRKNGRPLFCGNCRFGYDALYCLLTLLKTPLTDFFMNDFKGEFHDGFAASARISIPPYPYCEPKLLDAFAKDVSVSGKLENFWMEDVLMDDRIRCAGADGILGVMTNRGDTPLEAWQNVYDDIKGLRVGAYLQFRTDGPRRCEKLISAFQKKGIIYE